MTAESVFQQLKHPNPHLRERAMWEIVDNQDATTIPRLMDLLGEEDVVYRREAVKTLGAIGTDAVSPLVAAMLESDNVTVRGSAVKALVQIAVNYPEIPFPEVGLQGLKAATQDPNPVVHIAAVMALGEIGAPAFDILDEILKTTDNPALQISIVNALVSVGDDRSTAILSSLTEDESVDPYVRESAVSALSRVDTVNKYRRKPE